MVVNSNEKAAGDAAEPAQHLVLEALDVDLDEARLAEAFDQLVQGRHRHRDRRSQRWPCQAGCPSRRVDELRGQRW
jgi:hypothetical protein